jgi:hypothetical protein
VITTLVSVDEMGNNVPGPSSQRTLQSRAGVDGEAVDLPALLEFVIRPGALRVRISTHYPGVSPSGWLSNEDSNAARSKEGRRISGGFPFIITGLLRARGS